MVIMDNIFLISYVLREHSLKMEEGGTTYGEKCMGGKLLMARFLETSFLYPDKSGGVGRDYRVSKFPLS